MGAIKSKTAKGSELENYIEFSDNITFLKQKAAGTLLRPNVVVIDKDLAQALISAFADFDWFGGKLI
jgi:hypothetical protein